MENWFADDGRTNEKGIFRSYTARHDINVFKLRSYLEAFIKNEMATDGSEVTVLTGAKRTLDWQFKGWFQAYHFIITLKIGNRNKAEGKPDPCAEIMVEFCYDSPESRACWGELTESIERFLVQGYPGHSGFATPTDISVKTNFCVHDGGDACLTIKYDSGETEVMNLWASWYTPLDARDPWGLEQDILENYLHQIMRLDMYH